MAGKGCLRRWYLTILYICTVWCVKNIFVNLTVSRNFVHIKLIFEWKRILCDVCNQSHFSTFQHSTKWIYISASAELISWTQCSVNFLPTVYRTVQSQAIVYPRWCRINLLSIPESPESISCIFRRAQSLSLAYPGQCTVNLLPIPDSAQSISCLSRTVQSQDFVYPRQLSTSSFFMFMHRPLNRRH